MYIVYADDQIIYHPELVDHGFAIYNPTITQEVNKSGSFQFTMPVTNTHYNDLQKMKTIIRVIQNGEEIFRGRILNDERDFYLNKVIYCEGELAFLLDSIVRPYDYDGTIGGFFRYLVANHNTQVESSKQFEIGDVTVLADTEFKLSITDYISTWYAFTSYLLDVYGGYIRIRLDNGHRYLDYVSSYGNQNTQVVSFGTNMLDLSQYISAENVFTNLIPLGATYSQEVDPSEINPDHLADGEEMLKLYTELIDNKGKTSSPKYIFSLRVGMDSQRKEIINGEEVSISHIIVDYTVKTNSGTGSWSGLDGSKVYANLKIQDIRNTARYVDQKERIVATVRKPSREITTTEQTLLHWSGDVNTGSQVVTAEFINNYTASTTGALTVPISNSMSGVAQLQKQTYHKYTVATAAADEHHQANSDVLFDSTAEGLFGKIVAVHTWDDVEDPAELLRLGEEYLADNISMAVKLNVSAVDLNLLNVNYEKFKIGDRIRVISAPHRLDDYFVCSKVTLDLQHPENNTYGLGKELKTLTETQITAAKDIQVTQAMIEQINNSLDAAQTVVEQLNDIINTIYDSYADTKTIINNLDAAYADIDFANIGTAAIANLVANQALITSLDAAYIRADVANLTDATINNLIAGKIEAGQVVVDGLGAKLAAIDFANIVDAAITNLLAKQIIVDNVTVGVADINMANITTAGINRLKTNFADINFANITQAAINNLTANTTFTNYLQGNYADINFANITTAALQNALVNTGLFNSLVVQDDVVVGGTLSADSITVGTLKAERLAIRGLDGIYYQLNLAKKNDGDITQQEWDAINPDDLKEAFHGENIIANTITAKQIAAGSITTQKLAVLDASNVKFDNVPGASSTTQQKSMAAFISDVNGLTSTVSSVQTTVNSSVKSYTYRYFKSTSPTTQPSDADFDGASGSDTMPAREEGKYIWRRTTQTKNDNTKTKVYEMIQGADGESGGRGTGIYKVTTAPSSYTTTVGGFSPKYRISLATVKSQAGVNEVLVGDIIEYSYYHYPVGYVDANYVYMGTRTSIRGVGSYTFWAYAPTNDTSLNDMTTAPQADSKYIGVVSQSSSTRPTTKSSYTWSEYVGESITVDVTEYQEGTSSTSPPTGNWSETIPSVSQGNYLWTRITYSDGTYAYSVARQGSDGQPGSPGTSYYTYVRYSANSDGSSMTTSPQSNTKYIGIYTGTSSTVPAYTLFTWSKYVGEDGSPGSPGTSVTITNREIKYSKSTNGTTPSTTESDWGTSIPSTVAGEYLWTRVIVTYSNGQSTTAYSVAYHGDTGAQGPQGEQGIQGPQGDPGNGISSISYYYAVTQTQSQPRASAVTSTTIPTLSATNKYLWQKEVIDYTDISMADKVTVLLLAVYGDQGIQGPQGPQGQNATQYYTYIRYSANSNGSSMTTSPQSNTKYIGVYVGTSSTVPSYTSFTWSKYVGDPGTSSYTYVRYSANSDGSNMSSSPSSTTKYIGIYTGTRTTAPTTASSYTWSKYIGEDGSPGPQGPQGDQGASISITGIAYAYALSTSGTTPPDSGWGNNPSAPTTTQYLWTRTTVTYTNGTSSWDSVTYSVGGKVGAKGDTGPQGVSVSKVEPLYYLKSESTPTTGTAPPAPNSVVTSTATTAGVWTLSVPEYIEPDTTNNVYYFYWTCQQTTYNTSPATYTWSSVVPDSELNDIRVEMTRSNTLIEQNSENIRLQASTTEEMFSQAYDAATGAAEAVETERKARVSAIETVSGSITLLSSNTVAKSTYDADKEAWNTAIEELQTSSLTVESSAITAMVADISNLQTTQDSLATAFQVRGDGTYVFQSQVLNKTVTTIFYQKNSNSVAPTAPTAEVTSTSTSYNIWTKAIPAERTGYYYWTCDQTKYLDGPKAGTLECTTVTLLEETPTEAVTKTVAYPAIIESGYTKTTAEGMEVWVQGNEVAWNTATGSGTKEFSIGESASDNARWQFRRSGDLLNISWHS